MRGRKALRSTMAITIVVAVIASCYFLAIMTYGQQSGGATTGRAPSNRIDFNRDIRPILSDKCFACHGPDSANGLTPLRFDNEANAKRDLGGGRFAIVPGDPARSEMFLRVSSDDTAVRMPMGRDRLSDREIDLIRRWIEQGAAWQKHWAFIPPTSPPLPPVKDRHWPRNPIDYFVLDRLEREGLHPLPEADQAILIRRVTLDLTGLPPTPKEIDAFLNDPSPNGYEKVVDRLLASPRYGERMAFKWLDAARYADTNGYQIDGERSMWRWRDWTIDAFNKNVPFDRFTIEQLAGDLLPNPTLEQRIATAFNRNHRTNSEDGLIPEEYRLEYVVDRVDTTATVFLGLTAGCARCHDHKYDPLTQKDYYGLSAYFNSIREDGRVSNYGNAPPWIPAPTAEQQLNLQQLEREIGEAERRLARLMKATASARRRWEASLPSFSGFQWFPSENLLLHHALDENAALEVHDAVPELEAYDAAAGEDQSTKPDPKSVEIGFKGGTPQFVAAPTGQGAEFNGRIFFDAGKAANFDYRDRLKDYKHKFAISAWFYPESEQAGAIVTRMQDKVDEKEDNLPKGKGYGLFFVNGEVHFNLVGVWADDSFRVETVEKLPIKQWHHVLAVFDGTNPYDKVQIYINGRQQKLKINNGRLFRSFADPRAELRIGGGGGPEWRFRGAISEVRIYKAIPDAGQVAILSCADPLDRIAKIPLKKRTEGQRLKMLYAYLDDAAPADVRKVCRGLVELKQQKAKLELSVPTLMVMQEMPIPRPAFVLRRGAYDNPMEKVERGVPAILSTMPKEFPNSRLGLAKWLVGKDHPLTARVTVNRFWQMYFGTGLVKTVEDFGVQGEMPSHPELLDWLATNFQRTGWDVKALQKMIVTSATYRQSSKGSPTLLQNDPENRLLARGPRYRLSAEMIRDQALFISGLLVEKIGGPSVKTYQPPGLWKDMVFAGIDYKQDSGENLWRRSLYSFWKRTILPPGMQVFNASARETCTVREIRTNTPLQALNLMNDVTYVEASRMLAHRMLTEGGATQQERLAWAFRLATARGPDEKERQILRDNLNAQRNYFYLHPQEAARLLKVGEKHRDEKMDAVELAAYTMTASLVLNLDEVITKQ